MPKAWIRLEYNTENPKNFPRTEVLSDVDNAGRENQCDVEEFRIRKRDAFARYSFQQDRNLNGAVAALGKYDPERVPAPPPLQD